MRCRLRWSADLPFDATWAGRCDDLVLAGGTGGIAAVRGEDGARAWDCVPPAETASQKVGSSIVELKPSSPWASSGAGAASVSAGVERTDRASLASVMPMRTAARS